LLKVNGLNKNLKRQLLNLRKRIPLSSLNKFFRFQQSSPELPDRKNKISEKMFKSLEKMSKKRLLCLRMILKKEEEIMDKR